MFFECRRGCRRRWRRQQLLLLHKSPCSEPSLQVPSASLENPGSPFSNSLCLPSIDTSMADFRSHLDALPHASAHRFSAICVLRALHLSVVFTQLNDASQACQHFKSRIESQPSFFTPPDLPLSLLVIQHLLYHTNSSVITVQRSAKRAAGRSKWAFIANAVVRNGDAALVGCSMYTLSSPVVKTELTLGEADVGIMMSFQLGCWCVHAPLTSWAEMNPQRTSFHNNLHLKKKKKIVIATLRRECCCLASWFAVAWFSTPMFGWRMWRYKLTCSRGRGFMHLSSFEQVKM